MYNLSIKHICFFVMPGFSLIAYAAAVEMLRLANQLAQKELYVWSTITPDKVDILASNGIKIESNSFEDNDYTYDMLIVCGGVDIRERWSDAIDNFLNVADKKGIALASLCTGSYLLAKAGLLENYRFTIHWEDIALLRDEFPHLKVTDDIYEIDHNRFTCAGGTSPIDMFHHIISHQHGRKLAAEILDTILVSYVRSINEKQQIPISQTIGTTQPKLVEVINLMEMNLEYPLSTTEIGKLLNISKRHIERLFRRYLNIPPTRYYLGLRLRYARRLLLQSEHKITEISKLCGFSTSVHFSQSYRKNYGISPNKERRSLIP